MTVVLLACTLFWEAVTPVPFMGLPSTSVPPERVPALVPVVVVPRFATPAVGRLSASWVNDATAERRWKDGEADVDFALEEVTVRNVDAWVFVSRMLDEARPEALDERAFASALEDASGVAPLCDAPVLEATTAAGAPGREEAEAPAEFVGDGASDEDAAGLEEAPSTLEVALSAWGAGLDAAGPGARLVVEAGTSASEDSGAGAAEDVSTDGAEVSTDEGTSAAMGAGVETGASTAVDEGTARGCSEVVTGSAELVASTTAAGGGVTASGTEIDGVAVSEMSVG